MTTMIEIGKSLDSDNISSHYLLSQISPSVIKEAIDVLEVDFPKEAILLLARYNKGLNDSGLRLITQEQWDNELLNISKTLLEFADKKNKKR